MSDVQKVKAAINLRDVVSGYIDLKRAGNILRGLCPFHDEKTPSFAVYEDNYHCYGCGANGDVLDFMQSYHGYTFPEALQNLADRAGITLESFDSKASKDNKRYREILSVSARYYHQQLLGENGKTGVAYARQRGITDDLISRWMIGYSVEPDSDKPATWRLLTDYLLNRGYKLDCLLKLGLSKLTKRSGKPYDAFRGRLMFPIYDRQGVVGFSGRSISDSQQPKYYNSPASPVFDKSAVLFGMQHINPCNELTIVEGQLDAIIVSAHDKNVVAIQGSALTDQQLAFASKIADSVNLCPDGDDGGVKLAERAVKVANRMSVNLKVMQLPPNTDPAIIDAGQWQTLKSQSVSGVDWFIQHRTRYARDMSVYDRVKLATDLIGFLDTDNQLVLNEHRRKIALALGFDEQELISHLNPSQSKQPTDTQQASDILDTELYVISAIITYPMVYSVITRMLRSVGSNGGLTDFDFPRLTEQWSIAHQALNQDDADIYDYCKAHMDMSQLVFTRRIDAIISAFRLRVASIDRIVPKLSDDETVNRYLKMKSTLQRAIENPSAVQKSIDKILKSA